MTALPRITAVEFKNYKALKTCIVRLQRMNVLVGPNNCGKSTIVGAFRILAEGLRKARSRKAEPVIGPEGRRLGYSLGGASLPVSIENVHTDYADNETDVTFRLSNQNSLKLYFSKEGGCVLLANSIRKGVQSPADFKREFPITLGVVPVLGPVEHDEELVDEATVQRNLATHRASRNFRNYWYYNPAGFEQFSDLVKRTWPGMEIRRPEKTDSFSKTLCMFALEKRMSRELYWAGFGFQVWCQLLTHISRSSDSSLLVIDEPEIYLHPDVQRQLLSILREAGPDVLLATHSTEIMAEADPTEILLVDKSRRSAQRLRDVDGVQAAMDAIGSLQNITLTQLARNRRVLFVEGMDDFRTLRRFARRLNLSELAAGTDLTAVESGGFSAWERVKGTAWGLAKTLGTSLDIAAVFDRDFLCDQQVQEVMSSLQAHVSLVHIHSRKEMENYLLVPKVIQRAFDKALVEREARSGKGEEVTESIEAILDRITSVAKADLQGQYLAKSSDYLVGGKIDRATLMSEALSSFEHRWSSLETRLELVKGKETLATLRTILQEKFSVNLTNVRIIDEFRPGEIPGDLVKLLNNLNAFRSGTKSFTSRPSDDDTASDGESGNNEAPAKKVISA